MAHAPAKITNSHIEREQKLYVLARNFCLALPGICLAKHTHIYFSPLWYLCYTKIFRLSRGSLVTLHCWQIADWALLESPFQTFWHNSEQTLVCPRGGPLCGEDLLVLPSFPPPVRTCVTPCAICPYCAACLLLNSQNGIRAPSLSPVGFLILTCRRC